MKILTILLVNAIISTGWHFWIDDQTPLDERLVFTSLFVLFVMTVINLMRSKS